MTRSTVLFVCFVAVSLVFAGISGAAIDPNTLVGMWSFEEGSGDVAKDSSGKGNDGMLMNDPQWVDDGYYGKALEFAAGETHVAIPDSDSLDGDEITVAAWIKPNSLEDEWNLIVTKWFSHGGADQAQWHDWHFSLRRSGAGYKMNLYLTNVNNFFGDSEVSAEEWSHCAFTLNNSGDISLYLNGELDGQMTGTGGKMSTSEGIVIIGDARNVNWGMNGIMDEVAIYNVALSQDDIQRLMQPAAVSSTGKLATTWAEIKN